MDHTGEMHDGISIWVLWYMIADDSAEGPAR